MSRFYTVFLQNFMKTNLLVWQRYICNFPTSVKEEQLPCLLTTNLQSKERTNTVGQGGGNCSFFAVVLGSFIHCVIIFYITD